MIQRKYTPEYIELIRGRYYIDNHLDYQYLRLLISNIPTTERNYIRQYDFKYLWDHIWQWIGTDEQMQRIHNDYLGSEKKFNQLKQGYNDEFHGFLSFTSLFKELNNNQIEPDWEFPKGKRHEFETDQNCAIRECCEETALLKTDFDLFLHVRPFQEVFDGVNSVKYCNSYYLAKLTNPNILTYYDPSHTEQNKDIRKIGWFTEQEIYQIINPKCTYRFKMVHDINLLASKLLDEI